MEICKNLLCFLNKLVISFYQKIKNTGSLSDKFLILVFIKNLKNKKQKKHGVFGWQQNFKGSLGEEWAEKRGLKNLT